MYFIILEKYFLPLWNSNLCCLDLLKIFHLFQMLFYIIFFCFLIVYFFSFLCSVWVIFIDLFLGSLIFFLGIWNRMMKPQKNFSSLLLNFFVFCLTDYYKFHFSDEMSHLFILLFAFSSKNLNILTTVISNYLLGSFNILWLISESGSINCFVFWCFCFLLCCVLFNFWVNAVCLLEHCRLM